MYVHPVLCCSSSMYRYLPPTRCGECRGTFSGSPTDDSSVSPLPTPPFLTLSSVIIIRREKAPKHLIVINCSRRSWPAPRVAPVWSGKNSHYISVFDYTTQRSLGSRARKREPGTADYKILLYATPKSTIKLISSLTTCIISFSLKAREYLSCRAQVCVYMCVNERVCMELCAYFYQVYIKFVLCMYIRLYVIFSRAYASFIYIYFDSHPRLSRSRADLRTKFASLYSICKNIQVKVIVASTVKKFYTF